MEAEMRGLLPFNIDVKIIFKKLVALSCLPAEDIPAMFFEIKNSASPAVQATLREFFDYFENSWINGVTPRLFSFYEKLEVMTDCGVTGQVSLCQSLSIDGNIWAFTQQILKISNQSTKDFEKIQRQQRINVTPRVRPVIKRDKMERAWKMFATRKITLSRLFQLATILVSEHVEMLLYRNDFTFVDCELLSPNEMANDAEFEDYEYLIDVNDEEAA
ncbi:GSCOCG00012768001-RA-CDS [Cotesia congregata]|nr:GSCOCG00012768001-RA-CDS [Cotesia congregata]